MALETLMPGAGDDPDQEKEIEQLRQMWPDVPSWDFVTDGPVLYNDEQFLRHDTVEQRSDVSQYAAKAAMDKLVSRYPGEYLG